MCRDDKSPGYHYVVTADGQIHQLLGEERSSNGVAGYNSVTVNVAYTGGVDVHDDMRPVDNRTDAQKASLRTLVRMLKKKIPKAVIQGHRDFPSVKKDCPCDAIKEYKDI